MNINDIEEGLISKAAKGSINFKSAEVSSSGQTVHIATDGIKSKFKNKDVSNDGIVLEEVGNNSSRFSFSDCIGSNLISSDIKNKAESSVMLVTGADCRDLENEGGLFSKNSSAQLEAMLKRVKENREFEREIMQKRSEHHEQVDEERQRANIAAMLDGLDADVVADVLTSSDIPLTQANITKYMTAAQMLTAVPEMSDPAMAYMIGNELSPSVSNIYHAQYSGAASKQTAYFDENAWVQVQEQVEGVILDAGLEIDDAALEQAKWLFSYDLPITDESLEAYSVLRYIREGQMPQEALDCIVRAMQNGEAPEEASLDDRNYKKAEEFIEKVQREEAQYIEKLAEPATDIESIIARRQLEEIRLKMTMEAAAKLAGKGINIETDGLASVVEELYKLEEDYYKGLLEAAGEPADDNQVSIVATTARQLEEISRAPAYILGTTLGIKHQMTIPGLHEEAMGMQARFDRAGERYETMMTTVRKDMGDSIGKAFANMDSLMRELSIADTEDNRRAMRILGYNSMEITQENIDGVKEYDSKLRELITNLRPQVTIELVRRGYNPLDMTLDEVNEVVRNLREEQGADSEERYARYLLKLEKNGEITQDERAGYIGVYRLLNNIQKTDGAAIGAVVNAGGDVTLRNLLTAVRSKKAEGSQYAVDDDFGGLTQLTYHTESITDQLARGFGSQTDSSGQEAPQDDRLAYEQRILNNIYEAVSPEILQDITGNDITKILDYSIEQLYDEMKAYKGGRHTEEPMSAAETEIYGQMAEELRKATEHQEEILSFMQSYDIPQTIENELAVWQLLGNGQKPVNDAYKHLEETSGTGVEEAETALEDLTQSMTDRETLQDAYQKVMTHLQDVLAKEYEKPEIDYQSLIGLKNLQRGLMLNHALSAGERYEIPLVTQDSVTSMNLTIVHDDANAGSVQVSMDSKVLGNIQITMTLKEDTVNGYIVCDSRQGYEALQQAGMEERLAGIGMEVGRIYYTMAQKMAPDAIPSGNRQEGMQLYNIAKVMVTTVSDMERKGI